MKKKQKTGRPPGHKVKYLNVANDMRKRFCLGKWPQEDPLPSLRQLASNYKVSTQVIRLAVDLLKTEGHLTVTPRRHIKLRNSKIRVSATQDLTALVMGYTLPKIWSKPDSRDLLGGIQCGVGDLRRPLLIVQGPTLALRDEIPPDLLDLPLKGILLMGLFHKSALEKYEALNIPVVLVDRPPGPWKLSAACVDNEKATHDATMRMLKLGHRRIAFLRRYQLSTREADPDSKEREQGFRRAFKEAKVSLKRDAFFTTFTHKAPSDQAFETIVSADPPFTAVLAVDGGRAGWTSDAAKAIGKKVPKDLSIVTFGSTRSGKHWSGPRIDFFKLGTRAVEVLEEAGAGVKHARVATEWEPGKTLAPPCV